jgi:hypothetical protein
MSPVGVLARHAETCHPPFHNILQATTLRFDPRNYTSRWHFLSSPAAVRISKARGASTTSSVRLVVLVASLYSVDHPNSIESLYIRERQSVQVMSYAEMVDEGLK